MGCVADYGWQYLRPEQGKIFDQTVRLFGNFHTVWVHAHRLLLRSERQQRDASGQIG